MIELLTRFTTADAASADRFGAHLAEMQLSVPGEPGNLLYQVFRTAEDATALFVRERWSSHVDADRHIAAVGDDPRSKAALTLLTCDPATFTLIAQPATAGSGS